MTDGTTTTPEPTGSSPAPPAGTSRVRDFLSLVDGWKTYIVVAAAVVYLVGADIGWWPYNEQVLALFGFGGVAALRHSVRKSAR